MARQRRDQFLELDQQVFGSRASRAEDLHRLANCSLRMLLENWCLQLQATRWYAARDPNASDQVVGYGSLGIAHRWVERPSIAARARRTRGGNAELQLSVANMQSPFDIAPVVPVRRAARRDRLDW